MKSYIALSYCWHGPDWKVAVCLGRPEMGWPISTAMIHCLLDQRESADEGIWIDQCCIDQQDPLDKQLIIGSMDLFYKSARKVVVLLEDVSISKAEKVLLQYTSVDWKPNNADLNALSHILICILSARWFERAWCSHELQLSSDLVFLLPATPTPVELSSDDLEELYSVTSDHILLHKDLEDGMVDTYRSYDFFTRAIDRKAEEAYSRSLFSEFSDIQELACSFQTDVVCIAMNISGFQVYFAGHLRSPNECRWILAMVALPAGDATVLDGVDEILRVEDPAGTPSWLHWGNDLENTMTRVGYSKLREPLGIKSIDQYQITLDLLDFTNSAVHRPSASFYDQADLLVNLLSQTYIHDDPDNQPYWVKPTENPVRGRRDRRFVTEILACSFECGFEWMINQMTFAPNLAKYYYRGLGDFRDFGSRFWPMLKQHLRIGNLSASSYLDQLDDDKKISILVYFNFILFDTFFGLGSSPEFLPTTSPVSPEDNLGSVQEEDQTLVQCLWLDIGLGNKALVALPTGMAVRDRPSMPVALSNGSCAGTRRLWLLKRFPRDEDKVTRLTGKYHMFTLIAIEENDNAIMRCDQNVRQCT